MQLIIIGNAIHSVLRVYVASLILEEKIDKTVAVLCPVNLVVGEDELKNAESFLSLLPISFLCFS